MHNNKAIKAVRKMNLRIAPRFTNTTFPEFQTTTDVYNNYTCQ